MKKSFALFITALLVLSLLLAIPAAAAPTRAPSYCTVTFDGNLTDDTVSTVSVLSGNKLEASDLPVLSDRDGRHFAGWSIYHTATREREFDLAEPIEKDVTLYAIWETEIETAELYIRTPSAGEPATDPQASTTGWYADISIDTEATKGGYWWDDRTNVGDFSAAATFHGAFEAGKTYYGMLIVRPEHHRCLTAKTAYNIHGAKYYSKSVVDKDTNYTRLYFSVTVTAAAQVDEIELALGQINPNTKMNKAPARLCLTSGVENEPIDCWWEKLEDVDENYETVLYGDSKFESGKTYYTFFQLFARDDGPQLAAEPKVTLYGGKVAEVKTVHSGDYTYLYVIYAVQVPEIYEMCVSVETEPDDVVGGAFYTDIDNYWIDLIDGPKVVAGKRTFTAKAHIGYYFDGWYDCLAEGGPTLLTRDPVLVIYHDCFQSVECRFKKGEASDLWICDVPVTAANAGDVLGDGVFRYDAGSKTLTVNGNCAYKGCVIRSGVDGLTVNAAGNSTLRNTDAGGPTCALEFTANATITGGKLTVQNDSWNCGISVSNDAELRFKDAVVEVETDQYGITGNEAGERLVIENSALHVLAKPETAMAITFFAADGIELTGSALAFPEGGQIKNGAILKADNTPAHEVLIHPAKDTAINEIRLTVSLPKAGDKYALPALAAAFDGEYPCTMEKAAWYPDGGINPGEIVFEAGGRYFIEVYLRPEAGCVLDKSTKVFINGQPVDNWMQLNESEWCAAWWYTVPPAATVISEVRLTADLPSVGDKYVYPDPAAKLAGDYHCKLTRAVWYPDGGISGEFVFEAGGRYFIGISLEADAGYALDETTKVYINDKPVDSWMQVNEVEWSGARWFTFGSTGTPFIDIPQSSYFELPVKWAVEKAITKGVDATHFAPDGVCTRAQIVTFLWRAMGCPQPNSNVNPFKDVSESDYFYTAVLWAVQSNITNGTADDLFSPNAGCTRGQVVAFLWRANGRTAPKSAENPFRDVTAGYYYDAVLWAVENDITNGTAADAFSPDAVCTRGQIVTFLYRFMNP